VGANHVGAARYSTSHEHLRATERPISKESIRRGDALSDAMTTWDSSTSCSSSALSTWVGGERGLDAGGQADV